MATIAENIQTLQEIKENIRVAINDKGVECGTDVPFTSYSTKISEIDAGSESLPIIEFKDAEFKRICVENWGGKSIEGEMTYEEAAAVTTDDLYSVFVKTVTWRSADYDIYQSPFKGNTTITSARELMYFTGVTGLGVCGDSGAQYSKNLSGVFQGCTNLTEVCLPDSCKVIGNFCFLNCTALKQIDTHNIATFGEQCFQGSGVVMLDTRGATGTIHSTGSYVWEDYIRWGAFQSMSNLKCILNLGSPMNSTETLVRYCSNLKYLDLTSSVTSIGNNAIENNQSLVTVGDVSGVTIVRQYGISNNPKVTSLNFSSALKTIGFKGLTAMNGLTTIGDVSGITTLYNQAMLSHPLITDYGDFDSIVSVGHGAFETNDNLEVVVFGENLTLIGQAVFSGNHKLRSVTVKAVTPPTVEIDYTVVHSEFGTLAQNTSAKDNCKVEVEDDSESSNYGNLKANNRTWLLVNTSTAVNPYFNAIYVPSASVDLYKEADGWKDYADYIKAIPE